MAEKLLSISNLNVSYKTYEGKVKAVNNVFLDLEPGQTLGLVGESGAGKTTTALSIMRLIPNPPGQIDSGSIFFNGRDLCAMQEKELIKIRGNKISMIFQNPMTSLNPIVTVGVQLTEVLKAHQKLSEAEAVKRAMQMLETVQIPAGRLSEYPHEFSGGMRQRVGIAIALACNPQMIIADEPTTALDVTIQAQVIDLMRELREQYGTAMIMITHDLGIVGETCDRVAVMYAGEIVEAGNLEQIFSNPLHPYTIGLFQCIPNIEEDISNIKPIYGLTPDPLNLPSGCPFHPRCPQVMSRCGLEKPTKREMEQGHSVLCHLFVEGGHTL